MKQLAESDILAAGTLRTNRKYLPEEVKRDKLQKGKHLWRANGQAYEWRDNKNEHMLSNFHDPDETTEVSRKLANGLVVGGSCP